MLPRGPVGVDAFGRDVGISRFAFWTACGQPRWFLRGPSGAKSRRVSHDPASRPITSRPACASGSAATPPAAPRPMMTTSVSFNLVAIWACLGEVLIVVRRLVVRFQVVLLELLLIRGGHHRADARITD